MICCLVGCTAAPVVSSTSLSCVSAVNEATSSAAEPANVSRLQKPETDLPKRTSSRSMLDQAAYQTATPSNGEVAARIRAMVNGKAILDEEVREAIYPFLLATQNLPEPERSNRRKERFEKELQHLIEREVILQDMFARLKGKEQVIGKLKEAAGKEYGDLRVSSLKMVSESCQ